MKAIKIITSTVVITGVCILSGCGQMNATQQNTLGGAALGAAVGAGIGAASGGSASVGTGAAIGAAAGAIGGAMMTDH